MPIIWEFLQTTGFAQLSLGNVMMIVIGIIFISLAITKDYEPLLLVPIGFGVIVGNIPTIAGMTLSVYDDGGWSLSGGEVDYVPGSVLSYIYFGVSQGIFPPLIFLGIGAMTDFSTMLSNPKLVLLGCGGTDRYFPDVDRRHVFGFSLAEAGAIGIIGGADGPTAIFLARELAPAFVGCDRDRRLFLHGAGASHPAADHEAVDDARRAADPDDSRRARFRNARRFSSRSLPS